jgi:nicotinamidase-related amidase
MAPLLSALESCLLVVDPRSQHLDPLSTASQARLRMHFQLLGNGASAATVPRHYVLEGHDIDPQRLLLTLDPSDGVHTMRSEGPMWSSSGLALALAASNRPNLIICGFWLETRVSFLALCALSAGFDVYLVADAAPSRVERTRDSSITRLVQAGVIPTSSHQLLAEWGEQSPDPVLRAALVGLLD